MEKEHERQEELKKLNEEERKRKEKEYEEMQKKHKDHPKVHHPVRHRADFNYKFKSQIKSRGLLHYAPNFKEIDGAYWFRVVYPFIKNRAC